MSELLDFDIRPSTPEDLPAITEIYGKSVESGLGSFEYTAPDILEMTVRRNNILEQQLPYIVAVRNGILLGFAYASPYRARAAYRFSVENSVYVRAEMHRQGIGKALLKKIITDCEELGKKQMIAVIGDSQNRNSISLHISLGFRLVGILESIGYKHDQWVDTVILQKNLE
ncbi:GNAT family N-acetyltransferase [Sneathiella marina]|uniref:GNAT family N-acetyltransferase n=1 Tax=Sneathiella marina TaxID=2950108 RepID=A0ABY4W3X0_9PROT|nr:GNAT family N-acetyltransferase [Sneathiella marina]USG61890.1 GNAT family N-acetyltransferase [Sneathiella marina]